MMRQHQQMPTSARPAILAAARRLFAGRGYAGTSMREIASAAGVSKAAIYHHFRDKRRLYQGLLTEGIQALTLAIRSVSAEGPARAQLGRIILLHLEFAGAHADLLRMVVQEQWRAGERRRPEGERAERGRAGDRLPPSAGGIVRHHEEEVAVFMEVLRRGIAQGEFKPVDPALTARALCVVIDILSAGYLMATPAVPAAEIAQNAMDVLLNGLAAAPVPAEAIAGMFVAKEKSA